MKPDSGALVTLSKPHWRDLASRIGELGTACLRLLPPEMAHEVGMRMLERGLLDYLPAPYLAPLTTGMKVSVPGLGELPHPIGLAAGFDKDARCPASFVRLGFSFLEIGSVTPRPQPGNPKPRLFRQSDQRALINRMGFNSAGATVVRERLAAQRWDHDRIPLGVNCGKNKDTPESRALQDYLQIFEAFGEHARFFVMNLSSPNTPGLRELATPTFVRALADELGNSLHRVWIKLDPDMERRTFQELVQTIGERGFQGIIVSNTHRVTAPQAGGQSGHPLMAPSTACLEWAYEVHRGSLPMIGVGGVLSGVDIFHKLARGACAVEIYTALVYRGPWVVARLLVELAEELKLRGFATASDAIGSYYA